MWQRSLHGWGVFDAVMQKTTAWLYLNSVWTLPSTWNSITGVHAHVRLDYPSTQIHTKYQINFFSCNCFLRVSDWDTCVTTLTSGQDFLQHLVGCIYLQRKENANKVQQHLGAFQESGLKVTLTGGKWPTWYLLIWGQKHYVHVGTSSACCWL